MNAVNQWLLMVAVESTILLVAFLALLRWWNTNPFSRYRLSNAAITACMLLPLAVWLVPATITSQLMDGQANQVLSPPNTTGTPSLITDAPPSWPVLQNPSSETTPALISPAVRRPSKTFLSFDQVILIVWAVGFCAMIYVRFAQQQKLRRLVLAATPVVAPAQLAEHLKVVFGRTVSPRLMTMDHSFVPFVAGVLHPKIILPRQLLSDVELLKQVVTHEQAHIHRGDNLGLFWQQCVSAVFWWQPLLKFIHRELSAARECIADSYVVAHCDPVCYAENILRLAEAAPKDRMPGLAFLHQPPSLEDRVRHILNAHYQRKDKWMWSSHGCSIAISAIVLFLCGGITYQNQLGAQETVATTGTASPALSPASTNIETPPEAQATVTPSAEEDTDFSLRPFIQDTKPRIVSGRVLSPTGDPVADCLLLCEVYTQDRQAHTISTRTDDRGDYKLELPGSMSHLESYDTWVYKEGYGLRAVAFGYRLARTHRWNDATIVLPPADRMTVEVRDPNGQPIAGAEVEPISHEMPNGSFSADAAEGLVSDLPAEILRLVRVKTNAEGKVELNSFNAKLMGGLQVSSASYGTQQFSQQSKLNWKIQFRPVGSLRIKLIGSDISKANGSLLQIRSETTSQTQPFAADATRVQVNLDGRKEFLVPNLPVGSLQIWSWHWEQPDKYLPVIGPIPDITADEEALVEIQLVPAIEVKGRVVLPESLQPAKGVHLQILGRGLFQQSTQTDNQGNFRVYALPGPAQINFNWLGAEIMRGYRLPKSLSINVPQDSPLTVPDTVLKKVPELTVHVADASGKPLVTTEVIIAVQFLDKLRPMEKLRTDSDGTIRTPLDLAETEDEMHRRDPRSSYRFYLANAYNKKAPESSVPLNETSRRDNQIWLRASGQ